MESMFASGSRAPALLRIAWLLVTPLLLGCPGVLPQRSEGEKLYRKYCSECHGVDGAGQTIRSMGEPQANLLDNSWRHVDGVGGIQSVLSHDLVFEHPTFSQEFSREQIKEIVRHIRVLRGETSR